MCASNGTEQDEWYLRWGRLEQSISQGKKKAILVGISWEIALCTLPEQCEVENAVVYNGKF